MLEYLHKIQIQHWKYCRKPLIATIYWRQEISDHMLKNSAYFHFYQIATLVDFISAAFDLTVFQILKLDSELQIYLGISLKWNSMQRNIVHKLFIIMIDFT